jgi:phage protein D
MSAAVREPGLAVDYYAPAFAIEIDGNQLAPDEMGDVLQIVVTMDLDNLTSVALKLNNYNDRTFTLKWSDSDKFRIGRKVQVKLGYADRLLPMLNGIITTLSPSFPSDGSPTLGVNVVDPMVLLKNSKPPPQAVAYRNVRDSDIARKIAQRHNLPFKVQDSTTKYKFVDQGNDDDAVFLKKRARSINFDVFMATDPATGEHKLHFVRPADGRGSGPIRTYVLAWGTMRNTDVLPSLIDFEPVIAAANQVRSVTVRGWDSQTKQRITATANADNTPDLVGAKGQTGADAAADLAGAKRRPAIETATDLGGTIGKKELVVERYVESTEEALTIARAMLAKRSYGYKTAKGTLIGLPDLRLNDNVEVHGVGERFGGLYHVTKVIHTLNNGGYLTKFEARGA